MPNSRECSALTAPAGINLIGQLAGLCPNAFFLYIFFYEVFATVSFLMN